MSGVQAAILGGSALAALVPILRLTLQKRLPRRLFPALWCIAAARLLLPVALPSRLSVWNLLQNVPTGGGAAVIADVLRPFPVLTASAEAAAQTGAAIPPLLLVWAIGAAALGLYFAAGYVFLTRTFRHAAVSQPPCAALAAQLRLARVPRIRVTQNRRAPAWAGVCALVVFLALGAALTTQAVKAPVPAPEPVPEPIAQPVEIPTAAPAAMAAEAEPPAPDPEPAPAYIFPLEDADAAVTCAYGWRTHEQTGQQAFHDGVDLDAALGSSVLAVADGTVLSAEFEDASGYILTLEHADGVRTQYAHLSEFCAAPGDAVQQGQIIAKTGDSGWSTGPHLHLAVQIDGEPTDPLQALGTDTE